MLHEHVRIGDVQVLEVTTGSQISLTESMKKIDYAQFVDKSKTEEEFSENKMDGRQGCNCIGRQDKMNQEFNELMKQREVMMREKFEEKSDRVRYEAEEHFNSMLRTEQIKTLYQQKEMQRKYQDRVDALKSQLECRNLASLMYVMCSERTKSKIEKMKIIEAYTNHINSLQDLLVEGRDIILYLSKGYKSAAIVDYEWREKMQEVVKEFQNFLHQYMGGPPETVHYLLDLENLLKTNAPLYPDNDVGDVLSENFELPICTPVVNEDNKNWWETFEDEDRPFVIFGDMEDMNPKEKMNIKKKIKAAKTAPKQWKDYVFDDKHFKATCENLPKIKDLFPEQGAMQKQNVESYYRQTTYSTDQGYAMGTVLKYVVDAGGALQTAANKHIVASGILGAKDSLEIASTVKVLKEKTKNDSTPSMTSCEKILLGLRKNSRLTQEVLQEEKESDKSSTSSSFKSIQDDSFRITSANIPRNESELTYEKICPVDRCKRMRMGSFLASLPPYMRKSTRDVDYSYAGYETCSPEQLRIIEQRLKEKRKKSKEEEKEDILDEWKNFVDGVGVQTSTHSVEAHCTCPKPTSEYLPSRDITDFLPMKQEVDYICKERLFDSQIKFRRFKLIGESNGRDYATDLIQDLSPIYRSHPNTMSLFNTN